MSIENYGLTPAQVVQFEQQGYLGPFTAFPAAAMVQLRQTIYQRVLPPFVYEGPQQSAKFRHLDSQTVFKPCSAPAIIGRIASLLGLDLLLWHSTLFETPPTQPDEPEEYPWHQDIHFWHEPIITISAWLALTPATVANGCIEVIPATHKQEIPWISEDDPRYSKRFYRRMADPASFNAAKYPTKSFLTQC
jgi:chlorinating enzyme